jgi:hypothetical protein
LYSGLIRFHILHPALKPRIFSLVTHCAHDPAGTVVREMLLGGEAADKMNERYASNL